MNGFIRISGIVSLLFSTSLFAGQATFVNLLRSAQKDPVVISQNQDESFVKKSFSGIPGIDDIELQIRNTGFDADDFRYSVQVKPRGILETRAANGYNNALVSNTKSRRMMLLNVAIYDRYLLFIDLLEQKALLKQYQDLITLFDDRIKVMENLSYSEKFQLETLIKAENDRTKEMVSSMEIEKYITVLQQRARAFLGDTMFSEFDTTGMVSIKTIMERIETTDFSLDTNNAYLNVYHSKLDLAKTRFKLEKAETHRYLSSVSFIYNNEDLVSEYERKYKSKDYDFRKAYALEIGIKIPNLTLARHVLNKRKADLLSESENYEQAREELSEKVRKDLADLRQLIAQYRYLNARETQVDAEASLKKFLQIDGIDPLVLLEIKENILKNRINMTTIKYGILRNYLYVVDNAGLLSDTPLHNYLSENMEIIEW